MCGGILIWNLEGLVSSGLLSTGLVLITQRVRRVLGLVNPLRTDESSWSYGSLAGFPTGSGTGYAQSSGSGVSGWPYGNLTGFLTGSGYAQLTGTGGSDDSFGISFSICTPTSSVRLPPNPITQQFYPAISPATSPIVLYSTVTMIEFLDIKWLTHAMLAL